jgi:hypothetical protein
MAGEQDIDAWVKTATPEQIDEAFKAGKLDAYMGRDPLPAFPE